MLSSPCGLAPKSCLTSSTLLLAASYSGPTSEAGELGLHRCGRTCQETFWKLNTIPSMHDKDMAKEVSPTVRTTQMLDRWICFLKRRWRCHPILGVERLNCDCFCSSCQRDVVAPVIGSFVFGVNRASPISLKQYPVCEYGTISPAVHRALEHICAVCPEHAFHPQMSRSNPVPLCQ